MHGQSHNKPIVYIYIIMHGKFQASNRYFEMNTSLKLGWRRFRTQQHEEVFGWLCVVVHNRTKQILKMRIPGLFSPQRKVNLRCYSEVSLFLILQPNQLTVEGGQWEGVDRQAMRPLWRKS